MASGYILKIVFKLDLPHLELLSF